MRMCSSWAACLAAVGISLGAFAVAADGTSVRFATFNVSMYRDHEGGLVADLSDPRHEQARLAAAILQEVRPDVVLLNEFDWDANGEALRLFQEQFLATSQRGREPLVYPYRYVAESNTGVPSGFDLDRDGRADHAPGGREYGNDAFGYGVYRGQYAMAVLSRFPIQVDRVRTFRQLRWSALPGALIPREFYGESAAQALRLSSKNHIDVPIDIGGRIVHLLGSHPTPPSFDGPEDRNGRRNHDEIRFWSLYLDASSGRALAGRRPGPVRRAATRQRVRHRGGPELGPARRQLARCGDPRTARARSRAGVAGTGQPGRGGAIAVAGRAQSRAPRQSGRGHGRPA